MKIIIIAIFICTTLFTACDDVLDKQPLDIISEVTVWSDPVMIDDYLNECYAEMKFYFEGDYRYSYDSWSFFYMVHSYGIADEAMKAWDEDYGFRYSITINGGVYEWWGYPTIRELNVFIKKMETLNLTDSYKKQRTAEARFLRAFAYFNLVKRYGGVPLITNVQEINDSKEELYCNRDKEDDVYQFILTEIEAITNDLPEIYSANDGGRPTKYAALALRSRCAMYAGSIAQWGTVALDGLVGISQNKASNYWQASYDASKAIISSGKFALYNKYEDKTLNYRNIFLDENNTEVIFSERFDGLAGKGHAWDMWQVPFGYHVWAKGQYSAVYLEMVESYDNIDGTSGVIDRNKILSGHLWTLDELWGKKDPRFNASLYTHGTSWLDKNGRLTLDYHNGIQTSDGNILTNGSYKGVLAHSPNDGRPTPFGILKYLDESKAIVHERNYSSTDFIVFRLGEIYLNYAEAALELGKSDDALNAVNEIRKRAGMPLLTSISRELVRKERKVELAFEGNRYFDVRRWRTAVTDLTKAFHGLRYILDGASMVDGQYNVLTQKFSLKIIDDVVGTPSPFFDDKQYYLPISLPRTANNPNLIENPGYQ